MSATVELLAQASAELHVEVVLALADADRNPDRTACQVCGCVRHVMGRCALCGVTP